MMMVRLRRLQEVRRMVAMATTRLMAPRETPRNPLLCDRRPPNVPRFPAGRMS